MEITTNALIFTKQSNGYLSIEASKSGQDRADKIWLTQDEVAMLAQCLRGETTFYPFMDDNIHLLQATPRGFVFLHDDGGKCVRHAHALPGREVALYLDAILEAMSCAETTITVSSETLDAWRAQYGPVIQVLHDHGEGRPDVYAIWNETSDAYPALVSEHLETLQSIARNYSDGDLVVITLHLDAPASDDGRPAAFTFLIRKMKTDTVVLHGGIIPHLVTLPDGTTAYQYSMYT